MPKLKRPTSTAITSNMPLAEKLARIRRRVHTDGYYSKQHPDAPMRSGAVKGWISASSKKRWKRLSNVDLASPERRTFTAQELEAMWLAVCRLMDFCGGSKALLARISGFSGTAINSMINTGRLSPLAADWLGRMKEVPFSRQELRPDMSAEAWANFDATRKERYARRNERLYESSIKHGDK